MKRFGNEMNNVKIEILTHFLKHKVAFTPLDLCSWFFALDL